ncbi:hypothetical protein V6N13_015133 [Hibiscus sabdariffa]
MLSRNGQASSGDVRNYGVALSQKGVRIKSIGSMGKAKRGVVIGIRKHLWNQLHYLQPNSDIPWLLGGDFNTLLKGDERVRGSANVVGDFRIKSRFGIHNLSLTLRKGRGIFELTCGIDKALMQRHSEFLVDLATTLRAELDSVLAQEEKFWGQKACV